MADHVGRRRLRREGRQRSPPRVLDTPPPKLIPEALHTSPFKGGNKNSADELRDAPARVPMRERVIYKLKDKNKSKNEIANLKNREIIDIINKCLDKRCRSYKLQEMPCTRKTGSAIARLNEEAKMLVSDALEKVGEVQALKELPSDVPTFLLKDPVL